MPCRNCGKKGHNARTCFGTTSEEEEWFRRKAEAERPVLADDDHWNTRQPFEHMRKNDPQTKAIDEYHAQKRAAAKKRKNKKNGGKISDSEAVRRGRRKKKERLAKSKEQSKGGCNIL